ncbi:hypothetical protein GQ55_4G208000 [Panicum hallii var. hallii]|uniref:Uncharacterized protein n=1 Tax=Panicum hallii var. hallii TaxID=1504633 RepID=A0A2T7DZ71_9POAL|nr:hypothetical protein GQ55_4G208000 [Panicum hallii var. hallii]
MLEGICQTSFHAFSIASNIEHLGRVWFAGKLSKARIYQPGCAGRPDACNTSLFGSLHDDILDAQSVCLVDSIGCNLHNTETNAVVWFAASRRV